MSALGVFSKSQDLEFNALEGSLAMMSKVLNDVLDFNRMDSGKFESVNKPYALHQVLRSLCVPLRMATDARKLELCIDLDNKIDMVRLRCGYSGGRH
jgi:osomolarity two-component system, sensor histidine kinase SLN1